MQTIYTTLQSTARDAVLRDRVKHGREQRDNIKLHQ
ncbi:hypothetical protein HNQ59_000649 [Chitinivorax tropicus]|uniref:Uncharacterized protein n=1 Tax=Chitinivorax tropicus TaxID=714531 RepID=A0A840MIP3_9PROT|nr:hypothetical protein [Chitinivorax tropicus]